MYFVCHLLSACITIVANDNAYGVFSFDENSLSATLTEAGDTVMENNGGHMEYSANEILNSSIRPFSCSATHKSCVRSVW